MQPVMPTTPHEGAHQVVFGTTQPQIYRPLPAAVSPDGLVLTEWEMSADELEALLQGGRVRIWLHTFGGPMNPLVVEVVAPDCGLRGEP